MDVSSVDDMAPQYAALEQQRQTLNQNQQARSIYLVRHGSTNLNEQQDCIRGWKDVPLSNDGWKQAFELAQKFKTAKINVGIIFSSDLIRATATASALAGAINAPLAKTPLLRPWNLGEYQGCPSKNVHDQIVKFASETPTLKVPGGESFSDFENRALNGLRFALSNSQGKPIVIVAHHRIERLFRSVDSNGQINARTMFAKGSPPGSAEKITISLSAISGQQPTTIYAGASVMGPDCIKTEEADESKQGSGRLPGGS